jgi:phosphoribosylformylglycinamidine synthase
MTLDNFQGKVISICMVIETQVFRFVVRRIPQGEGVSPAMVAELRHLGLAKVKNVQKMDMYFVHGKIAPEELELLGRFLFSDPVSQACEVDPEPQPGVFSLEVTLKRGVTDPVADEIVRAAEELGIHGVEGAGTGTRYEFACEEGTTLLREELDILAREFFVNPVVQRYAIGSVEPDFSDPEMSISEVEKIGIGSMDDEALLRLDEHRRSALDFAELSAIRDYFVREERDCTDMEFEMLAQTWSEHCVHKTFKARIEVENAELGGLPPVVDNILATYIKSATEEIAAPWVLSAFADNAGIIAFDDEFEVSFKVETHNHPSAIEPFGGANTGVGGVIRDILGVSARPVAVTDVLCFGAPGGFRHPAGAMSAERIRDGVVAGVQDYGNKMGIPTVNGGIHYHPKYMLNPLVYCGCAGIAPIGKHPSFQQVGDRIVVIGGRTGRDGLRGATFSSMTIDKETFSSSGSSVQIGAPIVEKKVSEVVIAARDAGLYDAITDCGAGGLSSAVGEMAAVLGADIELSRAPLKYPGLAPWEIWLSEAQERMVLSVPSDKIPRLLALCDSLNVEACDLGSFSGAGRLVVRYGGNVVLDLDCGFLHEGMPQRRLVARSRQGQKMADEEGVKREGAPAKGADDAKCAPRAAPCDGSTLARVLSHHSIASKEWAIRRYDHEVQGATRIGPFAGANQKGPSDAAVLKPLETKNRTGIVLSNGFNARYGEADSYLAAISAVDEAVRNAVACGADPDRIALVDNFCWGDPCVPENMWSLLRAVKACHDASLLHRAPYVSGKDSFNNEFLDEAGNRISVPPSTLISAIGIIDDVENSVSSAFRGSNDYVYLVGEFEPVLSASVFEEFFPAVRVEKRPATEILAAERSAPGISQKAPIVYRALHRAMMSGYVAACHDISDGGLLAAISEMCIGGSFGADLDLAPLCGAFEIKSHNAYQDGNQAWKSDMADANQALILFGETNGCLVVEVTKDYANHFESLFSGLPIQKLGKTMEEKALAWAESDGTRRRAKLDTLETAFSSDSFSKEMTV